MTTTRLHKNVPQTGSIHINSLSHTLSLSSDLYLSSGIYLSSPLSLQFSLSMTMTRFNRSVGSLSIFVRKALTFPGPWHSRCLAVSPDLRALMEKARSTADDMRNVDLTPSEQVWSRQLYYMLGLSERGGAQETAERARG